MLVEQKKLVKKAKRIGRGHGSGKGGHTVSFGQKGQGSRGRGKVKPGFEGGNTPLYRKIPSLRGFKSFMSQPQEVTLEWIANHTKENDVVDVKFLENSFYIDEGIKVIGNFKIEHAITLKGLKVTKGAQKAIEKAGGKIVNE
jgi:large subunit ribosomal protein L15